MSTRPQLPVGGAVEAYRAFGFGTEAEAKIFRGNAAKLLRLSET